jgi:hypothetical protein
MFCLAVVPAAWADEITGNEVATQQVESGTLFRRHLISMDVWTGYAYLPMADVNKYGHDYLNFVHNAGMTGTLTEMHHGINSGLDLNFELVKGLKFGPRVGFLYVSPGSVTGDDMYGNHFKWELQGFTVPLSLGVSYSVPALRRVRFTFGADLGYALGFTTWSEDTTYTYSGYYSGYYSDSNHYSMDAISGSPYVNAYAAMRIVFVEAFGMDFRVGYHYAYMDDWSITSSTSSGEVGDRVYYKYDPAVVDFSGVDAQLGFSFYF